MNRIKQLVLALLKRLGISKDMSVDAAIDSFKKAVKRLEDVATHHDGECVAAMEEASEALKAASEAQEAAEAAQAEADRARAIAAKLAGLVSQ